MVHDAMSEQVRGIMPRISASPRSAAGLRCTLGQLDSTDQHAPLAGRGRKGRAHRRELALFEANNIFLLQQISQQYLSVWFFSKVNRAKISRLWDLSISQSWKRKKEIWTLGNLTVGKN